MNFEKSLLKGSTEPPHQEPRDKEIIQKTEAIFETETLFPLQAVGNDLPEKNATSRKHKQKWQSHPSAKNIEMGGVEDGCEHQHDRERCRPRKEEIWRKFKHD